MRKEFSQTILNLANQDEKIIFITGDLGFNALEEIREAMGERFINAGVAEQNMVGISAGLAKQGFRPFVYSIAPFAVYRCFEQIRNDIAFHNLPVTIVGNGGGYGYGIMGATHHAIEDYGAISLLNIKCVAPMLNSDVKAAVMGIMADNAPAYLRLGYGTLENKSIAGFEPWRNLLSGDEVTVAAIGAVGVNAYHACEKLAGKADLWVIGEIPTKEIPEGFINSLEKTKKLVCVEEHVKRGGFGEHLVSGLIEKGYNNFCLTLLAAKGYPSGTYGSQQFHRKESGIDVEGIISCLQKIL